MALESTAVPIPRYVLLHGDLPIGPKVTSLEATNLSHTLYAFSTRETYDRFCTDDPRELRPYPLVHQFVQRQIDELRTATPLVVVDPLTSTDVGLGAITLESLRTALNNHDATVTVDVLLTRDNASDAYHVATWLTAIH